MKTSHFLFLAILGLTLCLSAVACGPAAAAPLGRPGRSTLNIGIPNTIETLNPITMSGPDDQNFSHFIWAGLLGVNASGNLFPLLAKTVPTKSNGLISADGRSITFLMRRNLHWSDGASLTARDVQFGWRLAVKRWAVACPATCWTIRTVRVLSRRKVSFLLRKPYSPLLFDLPPVVPRHQTWRGSWRATFLYLYQSTTNFLAPSFAVDGPFKVTSVSPTSITFGRNRYWNIIRRPGYKRIVVTDVGNDASMVQAARNGEAQITQDYYHLDFNRGILAPQQLKGLHLHLYPFGGVEHLEANELGRWQVDPTAPGGYKYVNFLSDPRVRDALALALNRRKMLELSLGITAKQSMPLVTFSAEIPQRFDGIAVHGAWDPLRHRFERSLELTDARKLLSQAGWKFRQDGFRYKGKCPATVVGCQLNILVVVPHADFERYQEALAIAAMWAKVGVNVTLDYHDWGIGNMTAGYGERGPCARGWNDFCLMTQMPGFDPQTDFQLQFTSDHIARIKHHPQRADINFSGVRNPILDSLFLNGAKTYNLRRRASLYRQWQIIVNQNANWLPLFEQPVIVVTRGVIRGFHPSPVAIEWNPWALAPPHS